MIRVLRAADRVAMPWKNGGGTTREIMVWPPGAGMDDFDCRVSIAEVREAGPFSRFEGIDRTLMVLQGRLALAFPEFEIELGPEDAPLAFDGGMPCNGTPMGGPVTDLNVMARRGRAAARVERIGGKVVAPAGKTMLVVAIAPTTMQLDGEPLFLEAWDAALIEGPASELALHGEAYVIRLA